MTKIRLIKLEPILLRNLLKAGLIDPDPINYGINLSENDQISNNLYSLGHPLKGILWESTAVPEIRLQAKELASKIIMN